MMRGVTLMKIKKWFLNKVQAEARRYNTWIDVAYTEDNMMDEEDDCYFANVEETLAETEKAVKVRFSTGMIVGSMKGWTTWVPKSVTMEF